jgi:zinc D-Ala-D-Ala carboxypeptidase
MTKNFSLQEMLYSKTATELGLENNPSLSALNNLRWTCLGLERIRMIIGSLPIKILSGYRSPAVNVKVGGSTNSKHCLGQAADIIAPSFGDARALALRIADNAVLLSVDQVILENTWVHVSFTNNPRYEALTKEKVGYTKGIV